MSEKPVSIKGKTFTPYINENTILERIKALSHNITHDYHGLEPVILPVLKGSFIFASDLIKNLDFPLEIYFVETASYSGTSSTGIVETIKQVPEAVKGRHILIVEDIIDTGLTVKAIYRQLLDFEPASVQIATLLHKPDADSSGTFIKYLGFSIPQKFVIGYGLDYEGFGRNLRGLYSISDDQ